MKKPLLEELLADGNIQAIKVADQGNLLYFENQLDQNRHVTVETNLQIKQPDNKPVNQNPTLKINVFSDVSTADACLLKGSLLSLGRFSILDQVAHESAAGLILDPNARMGYTDYTVRLDSITGVNFTINHGVGGNRFAIVGFTPDNFDLKDLANLPNQNSVILKLGSVSWTAAQLRSTLVYTAAGKAVIPTFFKLGLGTTAVSKQVFNVTDISGSFGNYNAEAINTFDYDWDGLEADATYTNNVGTMKVVAAYKTLNQSQLTPVSVSLGLYTAFVQKGLVNDTLVNSSFKDSLVTGMTNAWTMSGNIPTPNEAKPLIVYALELSKTSYDQLAVLQWTKPQLNVLRLNGNVFNIETLMAQVLIYQGKYYVPYTLTYNVDTGINRVVDMDYGWAGLLLNNEWTIESAKLTQQITVVADPFKYAKPATAFVITDPTAPITVNVNGVEQTFINYYAFLDSNIMTQNREAGLVLLAKNS